MNVLFLMVLLSVFAVSVLSSTRSNHCLLGGEKHIKKKRYKEHSISLHTLLIIFLLLSTEFAQPTS